MQSLKEKLKSIDWRYVKLVLCIGTITMIVLASLIFIGYMASKDDKQRFIYTTKTNEGWIMVDTVTNKEYLKQDGNNKIIPID
jgi:hypothetical protein